MKLQASSFDAEQPIGVQLLPTQVLRLPPLFLEDFFFMMM
jgi:hypothetical protein